MDAEGRAGTGAGAGKDLRFLAVLLAVAVTAAASVALAVATPEDLFRDAEASFQAGDAAQAGDKLAEFRTRYPSHLLYWKASLMWARCAPDPDEAVRRFTLVAEKAPAGTKAECEMDLASLYMVTDRFIEAEAALGAWLVAHPTDERAEQAAYLRGICLAELGRESEAEMVLMPVFQKGTHPPYRALAGLTLASARFGRGLFTDSRAMYNSLVRAMWAADVRPQALLGAAKCATELWRPTENRALLARLIKEYPDTEEATEAREVMKVPARAKIWVQIGAYSRPDFANAEKAKWEAKGYTAALGVSRHGSLKLNILLLGPYATRAEAEKAARTLKTAGTGAFITRY